MISASASDGHSKAGRVYTEPSSRLFVVRRPSQRATFCHGSKGSPASASHGFQQILRSKGGSSASSRCIAARAKGHHGNRQSASIL
jgi:hypothetical protein